MNLQDIVEKIKLQVATESDVIKREVIREVIYKKVEEMLVWGKVVPTVELRQPDIRYELSLIHI